MNLNIFVAISLSTVLMTVIFVDAGTTEAVSTAVATKNTSPTTKTNAPKAGSSESTVNKALSSKTGPTSQSTASKSTTTKPGGGTRSNTPTTTPKPVCVQGTCTRSVKSYVKKINGTCPFTPVCVNGICNGTDESCVKDITGTCPFKGSCTKEVTITDDHSVYTLGCGSTACPTTTTTLAPSTKLSCCGQALCNQYQPPHSSAVSFNANLFYFVSVVILASLL